MANFRKQVPSSAMSTKGHGQGASGSMNNHFERVMDAKSFLRAINNGAQAKVHFFENKIKQMGDKVGKNFRLTSLDSDHLMFEDRGTGQFFWADITRTGGSVAKIELNNIKPIKVVEEKKSVDFDKNVSTLIESLATNNIAEADRAFNLIERQRFRSTVIPENGVVVTRDGVLRKVALAKDLVPADAAVHIAEAFARAASENVEITEGRVVRGTFVESDTNFVIPINEMTRRRIVARTMKEAAESAYKSPTFCKLVGNIAGLVSEGRLKDAVGVVREFFGQEQEFCTLTEPEMRSLVENTLAVTGEFNGYLAKDVSRVIFRANLAINRDNIVEAWSKTAQKAQESTLFERAQDLAVTETFEEDYQKFLHGVFNESSDILTNRARAYLVSMKLIQSVLSRTEGEEAQADSMQQMINALESGNPDTNTIMQAESLLARVSDSIIDSIRNVETFDQVETGKIELGEPGVDQDIGGLSSLPGGEADELGALGGGGLDMGMPGGEPAMAGAELGAPGAAPAAGGAPMMPESMQRGIFTPVEQMKVADLRDELDSWRTHGHIFLAEDGFEEVNDQFNRYIKRCILLGEDDLSQEFETIQDSLIRNDDVIEAELSNDPYSAYRIDFDVEANSDYKGFAESVGLDSPEGQGVATKNPKKSDGEGAAGAHNAGKGRAAKGGTRMDQPGKGLQKKSVGSDGMPDQPEMKAGKAHRTLKGGLAEGVGMDSPHGNGLVMGKPKKVNGEKADNQAAGKGAAASGKPSMGKIGGKGVVKHSVHDSDGEDASGFAREAGESEAAGSPDDGIQDKVGKKRSQGGKGLAETQFKWGTKRKARGPEGGRKKAKLASEDVTVSVSGTDSQGRQMNWSMTDADGNIDDALIQAIAAEMEGGHDMGGEPGMEGMGGADESPEKMHSPMPDAEGMGSMEKGPKPMNDTNEDEALDDALDVEKPAEGEKSLPTGDGKNKPMAGEIGEEGGEDNMPFGDESEDGENEDEEEGGEEEGDEEEGDEYESEDDENEDEEDNEDEGEKDEDGEEGEEDEEGDEDGAVIMDGDDEMSEEGGDSVPPFMSDDEEEMESDDDEGSEEDEVDEEDADEEEGEEEGDEGDEGEEEDEEDEEEGSDDEEDGEEEDEGEESESDDESDDDKFPDFLKNK